MPYVIIAALGLAALFIIPRLNPKLHVALFIEALGDEPVFTASVPIREITATVKRLAEFADATLDVRLSGGEIVLHLMINLPLAGGIQHVALNQSINIGSPATIMGYGLTGTRVTLLESPTKVELGFKVGP